MTRVTRSEWDAIMAAADVVLVLAQTPEPRRLAPSDGNPCEWNPAEDRQAQDGDLWHADATVSLGGRSRNIHVCQACSELPEFKRLKLRVAIGAAR